MKKTDKYLRITASVLFLLLFLSGCSKCASDHKNDEYEAEKRYMISSLDQKDNFSKLLYQNLETVDGTKYTLIRNVSSGIVTYQRSSGGIDFFDSGLEKTGEPHLTANRDFVYVMYENGKKLALLDYEKNSKFIVDLDEPQTDVSIATVGEYLYYFSKEKGLLRMSRDIKESTEMDLSGIIKIEGEIENLFLNKSSRGLMIMGDEFSSIYFLNINGEKTSLSKLKLKGHNDVIKNARIVEYDRKYYIKPGNEDFVLEFDYEGNFIEKRKMPDEE